MSQVTEVSAGALDGSAPWMLLDQLRDGGYERLLVCNDSEIGLQAVICLHSTALGPANGGVRMYPYANFESAAREALELARAMTLKWSAAGENRGGGKSIIIGDPRTDKSERLLRRFGRFVDSLRGDYWVGSDVGISMEDMEMIHLETDYVASLPVEAGGVGDIAPATARGVVRAITACAERAWGNRTLQARTVAVQGVGAVGSALVADLLAAGARVIAADRDSDRLAALLKRFDQVEVIDPARIHAADVDIFSPCAMGGVVTESTLHEIRARVVAGSANNVLAAPALATELESRGIVYAPDFIANAGGAIYDADQFRKGGFNLQRAWRSIDRIEDRVRETFAMADAEGISANEAGVALAERRLRDLAAMR